MLYELNLVEEKKGAKQKGGEKKGSSQASVSTDARPSDLSAYEQERQGNISQNKAKLRELGLLKE